MKAAAEGDNWLVLLGHVIDVLREFPDDYFHSIMTSPPYWGLRDYGLEGVEWPTGWKGCLGLEPDPALHIQHMVLIGQEVYRVLRPDGTFWLNYGDCYIGSPARANYGDQGNKEQGRFGCDKAKQGFTLTAGQRAMMPARVALALQEAGWVLRSEIIWGKPNPKPSSVAHRPTDAHEMVYLFSKPGGRLWVHEDGRGTRNKPEADYYWLNLETGEASDEEQPKPWKRRNRWTSHPYFYDRDAARMPYSEATLKQVGQKYKGKKQKDYAAAKAENPSAVKRRTIASLEKNGGAQMRTVWWIKPEPVREAHFATFPRALVERCFKLGTSEKGCCPYCEAPYVRLVVASGGSIGQAWHDHNNDGHDGDKKRGGMQDYKRETVGWAQSCECVQGRDDPMPCRVMDIFHGSGTSCIAANKLGLEYIGIEASAEYLEISKERIAYYEMLEELRSLVRFDGSRYSLEGEEETHTKGGLTTILVELGLKGADVRRALDKAKEDYQCRTGD